ncbi:MAG: FHA domain-containing protein [Anaerolineae bacterium]|jgi:pSer/pThr/pTyr-binding forkhead associated (FHA) protein|nr:FHA domain-containing protein [Anaerolineae bacterium]MBT7075989.1 FHA domain-containing protein [Anaerolineae bacterium]MBT7783736.1 FHA domain-containing protein [Anaerolineae bacterium]
MIMCPACQYQEVVGALFCSECGAQLHNMGSLATHNIQTNEIRSQSFEAPPPERKDLVNYQIASLQILDGGQLLTLANRNEFTVGRVSEGQTIIPDVDLTAHNAYEYGVSRLHVVLKRKEKKMMIMDLGSANGTYVDGIRLKPEQETPLSHGSIISLGKLRIQFLFQD